MYIFKETIGPLRKIYCMYICRSNGSVERQEILLFSCILLPCFSVFLSETLIPLAVANRITEKEYGEDILHAAAELRELVAFLRKHAQRLITCDCALHYIPHFAYCAPVARSEPGACSGGRQHGGWKDGGKNLERCTHCVLLTLLERLQSFCSISVCQFALPLR